MSKSKFWNDVRIEPKRSYRWIAQLNFFSDEPGNRGNSTFNYLITSFTKPTFEIGSETIINNFTSETEIVATVYQWPDISVTMIDVENSDLNVSSKVYDWLEASGYEPQQTINNLSNLYSNLDADKFSLSFTHLDDRGIPIEEWTFLRPQPTRFDFGGEVSYESDSIMTVTMGVTYVAAEYKRLDTSQNRTPGVATSDGGPFSAPPNQQTSILDGPVPGVNLTPGPARARRQDNPAGIQTINIVPSQSRIRD